MDIGTDVSKILSRGIYLKYKQDPAIKDEFENTLIAMTDDTDYDVYVVCLYFMSQLFKEKNGLSPFEINRTMMREKIASQIIKREQTLRTGIYLPNGVLYVDAWNDLIRARDTS